jgi:uncharacterized protein YjbK
MTGKLSEDYITVHGLGQFHQVSLKIVRQESPYKIDKIVLTKNQYFDKKINMKYKDKTKEQRINRLADRQMRR